MQLFLEAVHFILRLFPKARGHLLFSNYSQNNLPKPMSQSLTKIMTIVINMNINSYS